MAKMTTAEMIEAIKELSVLELNELVKACEEEFGVSAAAHDRRLHFQIPGPRVAVEEEVDERTLQPGALSLINGEPRAGEL